VNLGRFQMRIDLFLQAHEVSGFVQVVNEASK
jgi:hypothetical protein